MKELAAGSELADGPTGHRLSWSDGEATFYDRSDAVIFSRVTDAEPAAIVESYQHPNGEPLFDLGLPPIVEEPERTRERVMDPPAIETPPADDEEVDHVTVDAVVSELGWNRCPPSEADVLRVGEPRVGRAIAYRQSQFVYESVILPDYRHARCTFSSAGAARRFMIMELAHILRLWTPLPRINPTGSLPGAPSRRVRPALTLHGPEAEPHSQSATAGIRCTQFQLGRDGRTADIAASYRHPKGEPLFELSNQPGT